MPLQSDLLLVVEEHGRWGSALDPAQGSRHNTTVLRLVGVAAVDGALCNPA